MRSLIDPPCFTGVNGMTTTTVAGSTRSPKKRAPGVTADTSQVIRKLFVAGASSS